MSRYKYDTLAASLNKPLRQSPSALTPSPAGANTTTENRQTDARTLHSKMTKFHLSLYLSYQLLVCI